TFSYGLMIVGFAECILIGWLLPASKLREELNASSRLKLGAWFDVLIRWMLPAILGFIIVWTALTDFGVLGDDAFPTLYGLAVGTDWMTLLPIMTPIVWLLGTLGVGMLLSRRPTLMDHAETPPIP